MPARTNIVDSLGVSWKLNVSEVSTLSYDHPVFGMLSYRGDPDVPWLCDNVNTLYLQEQGSLPDGVLPASVCVRPKYDGTCGDYDLAVYPVSGDDCLCADNGCPQVHDLWLKCDECEENDTQAVSSGGDPGVECPDNPSYTMTSSLCGQTLKVTWYCCGGDWMADITVNGTFCQTSFLGPAKTRCPLTMGTGTSNCDHLYVGCTTGCIGIDEECDPPTPCDATDCANFPDTLTATFAGSTCFSGTVTMTHAAAGGGTTQWGGETLVGGRWSVMLTCNGDGTFSMSAIDGNSPPECAMSGFTSTSAECSPVSISFGSQSITELSGCTCLGDTVTLSVSA